MSSQSENAIGNILNDKESAEKIKGLLGAFCNCTSKDTNTCLSDDEICEKEQSINRKINIVSAILPFLDERTRKKATIMIKILEIVKIIDSLSEPNTF